MAVGTRKVVYKGVRVTVHSTQPFDSIMTKLYAEIGSPEQALAWQQGLKGVSDQNGFVEAIKKATGTGPGQDVLDGFMIFQEFNHGAWIPLFGVGEGRKCKRIIVGNPVIAITMLRHELKAGLSVPVELLVVEGKPENGGGVDLVYHLPSALIVDGDNSDLETAARALDEKFEKLVTRVAS